MKTKLLIAGLLAAVAAPSLALAQPDPNCVRSNNQTSATGTVLGAVGGALIGNAIAGRHNRGVGTVGGAVAGGVAGNVLAGQHNDPCPQGYYYNQPAGYGPPPPAYGPAGGEYNYGPAPVQGTFWYGAPQRLRDRVEFVQTRINRLRDSGRLSPREFRVDQDELNQIRRQDADLRARDGGRLRREDRDYLWGRLNTLSQRLRWDRSYGY